MSKKIALLLILFMVGSWCVFADDMDGIWITLGVIAGVAFIVSLVLILTGNPDEGMGVWNSVVGEEKPEESRPAATALQNTFLKHTEIGVNKDEVFLGVKFSW